MANILTECAGIPFVNRCSSLPEKGIWVTMPVCQIIPGHATPVNNPCYNPSANTSYWSYKLFADSTVNENTTQINSLAIPVNNQITSEKIKVLERIDGYAVFAERRFELRKNEENPDTTLGLAPVGFQYLKINNDGRYTKGVCVEYRLEIQGDYPETMQKLLVTIGVQQTSNLIKDGFLVPGYQNTTPTAKTTTQEVQETNGAAVEPSLSVPSATESAPSTADLTLTKSCDTVGTEGQAIIIYTVTVKNRGMAPAENVQYSDMISFDGVNLTMGKIGVTTDLIDSKLLNIQTFPAMVAIAGNLGTIAPGAAITMSEAIEVFDFARNGTFVFTGISTLIHGEKSLQAVCNTTIEAVELMSDKKWTMSENHVTYSITITSAANNPKSEINIKDGLLIPKGVKVRFTNFDNMQASAAIGDEIEDTEVTVSLENVPVAAGENITKNIEFDILSISQFNTPLNIRNTATAVQPETMYSQVFTCSHNKATEMGIDIAAGVKIAENN